MNSQLPDASFQIPFGVDASSNNLLLEGDSTLQNEFFGDATDITMSTPLASRPPTSRRGLRTRTPRRHPLAEATVQEELDENDEGARNQVTSGNRSLCYSITMAFIVPNDLEATPKAHNGTRTFGFPRFPLPSTITQFSTKPPDTMFQDTNPAINDFYPVYPCTPKRSPTASMPLPEYFTPAPVRIPMPSPSPQSVIIPSAALERTTTPLSPVVNPATGDGPSTSDISNLPAQVRPTTEVDPTPIQVDQISTPSKLQRPMKPVRKSLRQSLRSSSPVKLPEANDKAEVSSIPRLRSKARASSARRKVSEKTNPIQNPAPSGALEENRCKTDYCATVDVPSLHPVPESGESLEQQPEEPDREINLANLRLHDSLEKGDGDDFACGGAAVSAMRESVPTHVMNYAPSPSEHRVVTPKDEGDNLALPGTTAMKRMADETDDAGIHAPTDQSSSRSNVRDRGTKKARLDGDAHAAAGPSTLSRPAPSLPRKSMIQSQTHRRVSGRRLSHSDSRKLLGKSRARPTVSRRDPALRRPRPAGTTAKEAARSVSAKKTSTVATASNVKPKPEWDSGPGTSCGLTIPTAPAFHSDLLRQQRLLAKADQRKGKPDDEDTDTKNVSKSKVTKPPTTTDNACVRPPLIDRKAC